MTRHKDRRQYDEENAEDDGIVGDGKHAVGFARRNLSNEIEYGEVLKLKETGFGHLRSKIRPSVRPNNLRDGSGYF